MITGYEWGIIESQIRGSLIDITMEIKDGAIGEHYEMLRKQQREQMGILDKVKAERDKAYNHERTPELNIQVALVSIKRDTDKRALKGIGEGLKHDAEVSFSKPILWNHKQQKATLQGEAILDKEGFFHLAPFTIIEGKEIAKRMVGTPISINGIIVGHITKANIEGNLIRYEGVMNMKDKEVA